MGAGGGSFCALSHENVVAICDVNDKHLALAGPKVSQGPRYADWRKCLEQKDVEAVVCCTLDHTHAFVANWAMNRGKARLSRKTPGQQRGGSPRLIRATWLKPKDKLGHPVGTQRHSITNFNRVREMIRDGAIGQLQEVSAWGNRQLRRARLSAREGDPPWDMHYDLWLGPSPFHPYNPGYFSGSSGMNCLQWNMYWDFGSGQVGDMGSHTMDLAWNAIDAGLPVFRRSQGRSPQSRRDASQTGNAFRNPGQRLAPPILVSWYQGGAMPESPHRGINLKKIDHGALFEGSRGFIVADFQSRILIPQNNDTKRTEADMTYYKPRPKEALLPPLGNFQQQWISACKGGLKTSCDFGYASDMIEMMLLGLVAYRIGRKIKYDGATGQVTDCPEAGPYLRHSYRDGWTLNG